jgi:membrane protein required for colicin V production
MFDLIVILIIAVSALIGFIRGAAREVVTVVAFILAAVLAIFAMRLTGPIARAAIHPAWLGNAAAVLVVFLAAYILLRVIGGQMTDKVRKTQTLGLFDRVTPPERTPHWVTDAKLYPLTELSARALRTLAPRGSAIASKVAPALKGAVEDGVKAGDKQMDQGYDARDRKAMDDLLEKSR